MTNDIRWIAVPRPFTRDHPAWEADRGGGRVMFAAVVDVLAALDASPVDDVRNTLNLILAREEEHSS